MFLWMMAKDIWRKVAMEDLGDMAQSLLWLGRVCGKHANPVLLLLYVCVYICIYVYIGRALGWWCYLVGSPRQSANSIVPQQ